MILVDSGLAFEVAHLAQGMMSREWVLESRTYFEGVVRPRGYCAPKSDPATCHGSMWASIAAMMKVR